MMKPMRREIKFVKTPNAISSLMSPNDVKPPIIRYPVEFISVQNASQKSVRAIPRHFLFHNQECLG